MIAIKKNRFKPRFKKLVGNKITLNNKKKILSFQKKKWYKQKLMLSRLTVNRKRNCYYKFYDQKSYTVPRFMNRFTNKFKQDLVKKRSFKLLYGNLSKKKVLNLLNRATSSYKTTNKSLNLKNLFSGLLEKKLDVIIVRSYFALNIRSARQLISHRHVKINGQIVTSSSNQIKVGDKIEFSQDIHSLIEYRLGSSILWPVLPTYLQVSYKIFQIIIISDPSYANSFNSLGSKFDFNTIMRLYK